MNIHHPVEFIPKENRLRVFYLFLGLTIIAFLIFQNLDQPIRTSAAPSGIVSFELAGTVEKSQAMMDSWNQSARLNNAFGLGFDFLFMPLYSTALSLGTLLATANRKHIWINLGIVFGWLAYLAIAFDAIENVALFFILQGNILTPLPQVAFWCASIKFCIIIFSFFVGIFGWLIPNK